MAQRNLSKWGHGSVTKFGFSGLVQQVTHNSLISLSWTQIRGRADVMLFPDILPFFKVGSNWLFLSFEEQAFPSYFDTVVGPRKIVYS